jgi:hypothetical protein
MESKRACEICHKNQAVKGYHILPYRALFGIVNLKSPRLFHCKCHDSKTKTFSPLSYWLLNKNDAELQYIETNEGYGKCSDDQEPSASGGKKAGKRIRRNPRIYFSLLK